MSLETDGSPYPVLLPASKIIKYSKLPDCSDFGGDLNFDLFYLLCLRECIDIIPSLLSIALNGDGFLWKMLLLVEPPVPYGFLE